MGTSNVTVRVDDELKKQAEELFSDLGLTMTAAMMIFMKQAVREQRIPFELTRNRPNRITARAIAEMRENRISKKYDNIKELMDELDR